MYECIACVQSVSLPDRQTLRGDSTHEDKHYWIGNYRGQTFSVGASMESDLILNRSL